MSINKLGIECETNGKTELIRRLKTLKTTVAIEDRGTLLKNPINSNLAIDTYLTEDEIDNWIWKVKIPCECMTIFERQDDFIN